MIALLLFSALSGIIVSSEPDIDFDTPPTPNNETIHTDSTTVGVSLSDSNDISAFIDWNRSLISYYSFENYTADFINDDSTYMNNIADSENNFINFNNFISNGIYGNALLINGTDDKYLNLIHNDNLNITNEITIEAWIKENETTFNNTFGISNGESNETGYCIQQTNDGGYIVTGEEFYYDSGVNIRSNLSLVKFDSNGNLMWNKTFESYNDNGNDRDAGAYVNQTTDGGYIITGQCSYTGAGTGDIWLIKTDSQGNHEWNKTYGWNYGDDGRCVKQTTNGGYIITGISNKTASGYTSGDLVVIKTDNLGNEQWIYTYDGDNTNDYDCGYSVIQNRTDGLFAVTGIEDLNFTDGFKGDLCLIIFDNETKNIYYNETYGGNNYDIGTDIDITSDGGYILTGTTGSFNPSGWDVYLIKTNEDGNLSGANTFQKNYKFYLTDINEIGNDEGKSVKQTSDGGFIITGYWRWNPIENKELLLFKTDSSGNKLWNRSYGSTQEGEIGYYVQETSDGGFVIIGNSSFNQDSDMWIIKTDSSGNISTDFVNNQSKTKTIIGKNRSAYEIELHNGTIYGYVDYTSVSSTEYLSNLTQRWNHIVLTYDGVNIKLFINKTLVDNKALTSFDNTNTHNLIIGRNFSGLIDEVRIWKRALSWEEINISHSKNLAGNSLNRSYTNLIEGITYPFYSMAINTLGENNSTGKRFVTIGSINYQPDQTNEGPTNGSTGVDLSPNLNVTCSDDDSDLMNATWRSNSSGSWKIFAKNLSITTGTNIKQTNSNFSVYSTKYWWSVNLSDGHNWNNVTYHFTTESENINGGSGPGSSGSSTDEEEEDDDSDDEGDNSTIGENGSSVPSDTLPENIVNVTIENVTEGETIESDINKTIIIKVNFKAKRNLTNLKLKITDNDTAPPKNFTDNITKNDIVYDQENFTIENFTIYRYFDIDLTKNDTYVEEDDLETVKIRYKVNKSWIDKYDFTNTSDIYIYRYHNGKWQNLSNMNYDGNKTFSFYEAVSPGLSTFAVVGGKVIDNPKDEITKPKPGLPWIIIIGFIIAALVILVFVLFKSGYIYVEEKEIEE